MDCNYLIPGEPHAKNKPIPFGFSEVPCPTCFKPMLINTKKLIEIYFNYFIDFKTQEMEPICFDCLENDERFEEPTKKKKKPRFSDFF